MVVGEISGEQRQFLSETMIQWGRVNYRDFPWRSTENQWHALVAEFMLQRTKAEQVLPVYNDFTIRYPTPGDYARDDQASAFKNLGLHWREALLKELSQSLGDQVIPHEKEKLLKLPGVGSYIAAAFRSMHLGLRDTIIDSNVVRLYGRFFGFETDGETRRKKWFINLAEAITPETAFTTFNYGLLDFTREICKPKPACDHCPLQSRCMFYNQ